MTLAGISLMVLALDQVTKFLVLKNMILNESSPLLPNFIYFTYIQNPGTAFGFMSNLEPFVRIPFFIAATLAATFIVYMYQRLLSHDRIWTRIALGLVWGGALGNLVDRLLYGKVVDFIEVRFYDYQWFPYIFNVADSCITVGLTYLLFEFIIMGNRQKTQA
jgi:signal peptidase II